MTFVKNNLVVKMTPGHAEKVKANPTVLSER